MRTARCDISLVLLFPQL